MELNFAGLLLLGVGTVMLGLGISGNYKTFFPAVIAGVTGQTQSESTGKNAASRDVATPPTTANRPGLTGPR